jgi:hypothetical protein
VGIGAAVVAVVAGLAVVDRTSGEEPTATPTSTTAPPLATTTTGVPSSVELTLPPATTSAPAAPTVFAPPESIAALGESGTLHVLRADGELTAVDLATGATTLTAAAIGPEGSPNGSFVVLGDGALVTDYNGRLVAVPFDGSPEVDLGRRWWVAGASATMAAIARDDRPTVLVDGRGQQLGVVDLGEHNGSAVRAVLEDRLVVEAAGRIGLVDPATGEAESIGTGAVLAANNWGMVQLTCPDVTACEVHWGPWDDPSWRVLDASLLPRRGWAAGLSADGSALLVQADGGWALVGADGEPLGAWSGVALAIALGGPSVATLDHDGEVNLQAAGGPALTLVDPEPGNQARRGPRVVAIAHVPAP